MATQNSLQDATPKPQANTTSTDRGGVPTANCPTCISGIHPSSLKEDHLKILKR